MQPVATLHRILRDEADLEAWLAEARTATMEKLPNG